MQAETDLASSASDLGSGKISAGEYSSATSASAVTSSVAAAVVAVPKSPPLPPPPLPVEALVPSGAGGQRFGQPYHRFYLATLLFFSFVI